MRSDAVGRGGRSARRRGKESGRDGDEAGRTGPSGGVRVTASGSKNRRRFFFPFLFFLPGWLWWMVVLAYLLR